MRSFKPEEITPDVKWFNPKVDKLANTYVDANIYNALNELKVVVRKVDNKVYDRARRLANPFENIPRGFLRNRSGLKIANIDSLFNVTNAIAGQTLGRFVYGDVAGGPGAWTQYIQYIRPTANGYGISLKTTNNAFRWDYRIVDHDRFVEVNGSDESGDIYRQAQFYVETVKKATGGLDLVVADGGTDVPFDQPDHEPLSIRLILSEVLIGILATKVGGNFVVKVFNAKMKPSMDLLYMVALAFEQVAILKPITSRPSNAERYLIAKGRREIPPTLETLLLDTWKSASDTHYPASFLRSVPKDFTDWVTTINNNLMLNQYNNLLLISTLLNNQPIYLPVYNVDQCLVLWGLPSQELPRRDDHCYYPQTIVTNTNYIGLYG
jgi:23S rRNA U2552 (ribose-2'-O)-methylase RlmE/FtsJ